MPGQAKTDFLKAAERHYTDAAFLQAAGRVPTADHLAGVAAECGLKAIALSYLGGALDTSERVVHSRHPKGPTRYYGHVNTLWRELAATAHGRAAAQFDTLIGGLNPFNDWDVSERYSDGNHIDACRSTKHLLAAHRILSLFQQASIDGLLP